MDKYIIKFVELPWNRILAAGLVAAFVYWYLFFDSGATLRAEQEQAQQQHAELERLLKVTKDKIADADRFENEVRELVEQFNRATELMPAKMSTAELTTTVTEMVTRAGARLIQTEPKLGGPKGDFFETTGLAITVEGSFSQIAMFLSFLSRVPKLFTFDKVEVGTVTGSDAESPILTFRGVLLGYRYTEQAPALLAKPPTPKPNGAKTNAP
jgi:Tfp pilus assembly protein PilO